MKRAVVIGAGLGGLACAARLATSGVEVTVFEANQRIGGKCGGERWDGYTVDFAPHVFSMSDGGEVARVCRLLGEVVPFVVRDPIAEVRLGNRIFSFPARFRSPADAARLVLRAGIRPDHLVGAGRHFLQLSRGAPDLAHRPDTDLRQWVRRYTNDPTYLSLINLFSFLAFVEPYDRSSAQEMGRCFQRIVRGPGIGYPKGGCAGLVEAQARGIRRHGGRVLLGQPVDHVEVRAGVARAVWSGGQRFVGDAVFSNAGILGTARLVGEDAIGEAYAEGAHQLRNSMAGIMIRYTLRRRVIDTPVLFAMPATPADEVCARIQEGRLVEAGMGYYVNVPSNFDPDLAPRGGQVVIAGTLAYPDVNHPDIEEYMLLSLERRIERLFPGFADAVRRREPTMTAHVAAASGRLGSGDSVGVSQTPQQCGDARPSTCTPVERLFVVGADTGRGAIGTELAAGSGLAAADLALRTIR